jgi:hypothetical protein
LIFLGLGLVQPLTVITAFAVIAGHQVALLLTSWRRGGWPSWRPWLLAALRASLIPLPLVAVLAWQFLRDPYLQAWTLQNRILSPNPLHYLVAYGMLLPAAGVGAWQLLKRLGDRGLLPVVYAAIFPLLAYVPHNLQRRLPDGVWLALAILAAAGLAWLIRRRVAISPLAPLLIVLSLLSSLLLLVGGVQVALNPAEPAFRTQEEVQTFQWLESEAKCGKVALAGFATSNALPAWAPLRVLVGHGPESADLEALLPKVQDYYRGNMDDTESRAFLEVHEVDFVVVGPRERALGNWDPFSRPELILQYREGDYEVYSVGVP